MHAVKLVLCSQPKRKQTSNYKLSVYHTSSSDSDLRITKTSLSPTDGISNTQRPGNSSSSHNVETVWKTVQDSSDNS